MLKNIKLVLVNPSNICLCDPLGAEPLGLMYIEGVLQQLGIQVEMVDLSFDNKIPKADGYLFSATSINFAQVVEYAKQVKPAYTIIGGPHASALPEEAIKFFDVVVIGPGEAVIEKALTNLFTEGKGGIYQGAVSDIDSIPIPPRHLLKRINYTSFPDVLRSANIISARGCPFKCAFCASNVIWGRQVRFRSTENVVKEIKFLKKEFNVHHFKFVDDTFTLNKRRFRELSDALSDLDISWKCNTRVDTIDDEILNQAIASNCLLMELGIESVDNFTLAKIQKSLTVEDAKTTIAKIKSWGLDVKIFLIHGLPFEPKDIVKKTIEFIKETKPNLVTMSTFVPFPGTDICRNPQNYNVKKIFTDYSQYQLALGGIEEELSCLPNIEYFDRSREQLRSERNTLKKFALSWNKKYTSLC